MKIEIFSISILILIAYPAASSGAETNHSQRGVLIEEKIVLRDIPPDNGTVRIWLPYPQSKKEQVIEDFKIDSPVKAIFTTEPEYGNKVIYLEAEGIRESLSLSLSFVARREEYTEDNTVSEGALLKRFLKPDRRVPVNGEIKNLALNITRSKRSDMEKVRSIYDYLRDELTYSKDDPAICGIGDSLITLRYKKGICTDYHSLFISLVRSIGIPARFEIGFPIPENVKEGKINGYHCWAEFYIEGNGWIPVDISEADKHPENGDYFFGHLDENRVHLTTGRDINLNPQQEGEALNFFVFPYVEIGGKPFDRISTDIVFKDLT